ncbi:flagellar hook-length control protein FliK [Arsukibacterium perlucidum]|uniref:flagellar hook-length control protein FliK n=1 Tax=Arsukibacterium perlucidum TaxID=368811 RepID=UPI0003740B2E|nr:flagellar hook-length control protein FliK [Arsukibacterium perlucidum]
MNPLLSVSFLSSGPGAMGVEPDSREPAAVLDETGGGSQFRRLLNQSGEQQQTADRQSFAGFTISGKGKQTASMEGQPAGQPDSINPPVIPPEAELSLEDESNAGTLLGLLDLASQTRLLLTAGGAENAPAAANAGSIHFADSDDASGISGGIKLTKGEWFILPVYPEITAAGTVNPEQLADPATIANSSQSKAEHVVSSLLSGVIKDSAEVSEQSQPLTVGASGDKVTNKQHNDNGAVELARQALANQASDVDLAVSPAQIATVASDAITSDIKGANKVLSAQEFVAVSNDKLTAAVNAPASAVVTEQSKQATGVAAELLARQRAEMISPDHDPELTAELKALANADLAAVKSPTLNPMAETVKNAAELIELQKATTNSKSAATTIFENSDSLDKTSVVNSDGKPGSTLASAAAVAEVLLAKQQQRDGTAENNSQSKKSLVVETDAGSQQIKVDPGLISAGVRSESGLSGFGGVGSQARQSQSEAILARLDAATAATAATALQTAERTKAQSVNTSVTEQLKQVNLLAQNAAGQLKERINMMVRQNIQVAEIRLDPADLGQMQIRVNLQQDQATVQFIVQQQHAKELLEQQMPRLREMMQQQGIQLGEGNVQQQRQGNGQASAQRDGNAGAGQGDTEQHSGGQATAVQLDVKLSERIVDYYA